MKAKFGREIGLMMLPVLIIGGVAMWRNWNGPPAPIDTSGPPRLVLSPWTKIAPTPLEVALGNTVKVQTTVTLEGQLSPGVEAPLNSFVPMYPRLFIEYQQKGRWIRQVETGFDKPYLSWGKNTTFGKTPERFTFGLPLPFDKLPRDIEAVRLSGTFKGRALWQLASRPIWSTVPKGTRYYSFEKEAELEPTIPVSTVVWKRGDPWPNPQVSRDCPLQLESIEVVDRFPVGKLDMRARVRWNGGVRDWRSKEAPRSIQYRVLDSANREIPLHTIDGNGTSLLGGSNYAPNWTIETADLPLFGGALTLESQISVKDSWPLTVKMPIRTEWMGRPARYLKLLSQTSRPSFGGATAITAIVHGPNAQLPPLQYPSISDMRRWLPLSQNDMKPVINTPPLLCVWFARHPHRDKFRAGHWEATYFSHLIKPLPRGQYEVKWVLSSTDLKQHKGKTVELVLALEGDGLLPLRFKVP